MICTPFTGQPVKGGIFMRYSYEFKRKAIELFYLNTKLWDTMVL